MVAREKHLPASFSEELIAPRGMNCALCVHRENCLHCGQPKGDSAAI